MNLKKKIILFITIKVIVLALLGLLAWWYYSAYIQKHPAVKAQAVSGYAGYSCPLLTDVST